MTDVAAIQAETATLPHPATVGLSVSAAKRISTLIKMQDTPDMMFRIGITGGGCAGFSYNFNLDNQVGDDDKIFDLHGVKVVVDETSLEFVNGAEVDYVEDLMGSTFRVSNPNATSSCGCGTSFGV